MEAKPGADLSTLTVRERQVAVAAARGSSTGVIAAELSLSPRTVEHHLSAAYRKLGVGNRTALAAILRDRPDEPAPVTRYAQSGDAHIAFQVIGNGERDVVLVPGFISNVENAWTWPSHAAFLHRLARGRRLIVFDKCGTGLSDPVANPAEVTLDQRMDEIRAVMDAAGSRRAALFGFSEGAPLSMLFAATYPSRTNGLILYGALISSALDPQASGAAGVFADPAQAWEIMRNVWGTGQFLAPFAPSVSDVPSGLQHIARFERHGASPAAAYAIIRMAGAIEARGLCPAVHSPSLVLHRRDDLLVPVANSRYLATHLPDARYTELPGRDHPPWLADDQRLLGEIDRFLAHDHPSKPGETRLLRALLVADRPFSPPLLGVMERFHGRPARTGDKILYLFDGVVRAVECSLALTRNDQTLRLAVHAGEVSLDATGVAGAALDVAAGALRAAASGQVVVTSVVKDLALGSDLDLAPLPRPEPGAAGIPLFLARLGI